MNIYEYQNPDRYCFTTPDGECVSTDPRCMHNSYWEDKDPFQYEPVVQHPWLWRLVGPLVVRWKQYEEYHQPRSVIKSVDGKAVFTTEAITSWWWRNVTSRFSRMATKYDYFWPFMCPHCSYDCDGILEQMEYWNRPGFWYQTTGGGSYFNGDYTCQWFEGIVTCPRCLYEWDYGDSN